MAKRGVMWDSAGFTASDVSMNVNRNIVTEQAFGLGGEPYVYSGGAVVTGSISGGYRTSIRGIFTALNTVIATGTNIKDDAATLIIADEYGGVEFTSAVMNSAELSMQAKDYGKCTFNFFATGGIAYSGTPTDPSYSDPIPLFYSSTISVGGVTVNDISGFSIKLEVPIDQDYFVFGSRYIQDILQNGNGTVTGTLSFGAKEWSLVQSAITGTGNLAKIIITLKGGEDTPTDMKTVEIDDVVIESGSFSGQGRQRFTKTVNWRAPCRSDKNQAMFKT